MADLLNQIGFKSITTRQITSEIPWKDDEYYGFEEKDEDGDAYPCGYIYETYHDDRVEVATWLGEDCSPKLYCETGIGFSKWNNKAIVAGQMVYSDEYEDHHPPEITLCDIYNVLFVDVSEREEINK